MRTAYLIVCTFLKIVMTPFFPMRYVGRENIPEGAAIICANHSASSDPVLVAIALGAKTFPRFMAKMELFRIPVLGSLLRLIGVFPVDRRKPSDTEAIRIAMGHLKNGNKIMLFPEGTRVSPGDAIAAKTCAIRLSMRMQAPILPIKIPRNKRWFRRDTVYIGEPYIVLESKREDYKLLSDQLMERIDSLGGV